MRKDISTQGGRCFGLRALVRRGVRLSPVRVSHSGPVCPTTVRVSHSGPGVLLQSGVSHYGPGFSLRSGFPTPVLVSYSGQGFLIRSWPLTPVQAFHSGGEQGEVRVMRDPALMWDSAATLSPQ